MKMTRIAVVTSYFYPKIGGLENYAYNLAKHLHATGEYQVSIITSNYQGNGYKKETIDGMVVHRLPIWFRVSNTPVNPLWYWQVKKIFAAERPDVVHLHSPVPFLPDVAAQAAKQTPIVLTYHAGSMRKGKWPIDAFIGIYENIFFPILLKRANAIVAISQDFAKKKFPHFSDKTYFIPTGVELERFKRTPMPTKTEVVTFVGRIEHTSSWKGIEQLLQAMVVVLRQRPQVTLELVGGGDAILHFRARAKELNIGPSVIFSGPQVGAGIVEAYQRASVVVLPSTSDAEAFSVALIEAMASGRPVVGTNIGGTPQVIKNEENGLLVPAKDPQALAEAIERVLGDRTLAARLADAGAAKARDFSWEIQTKKYSNLFHNIL